MDAVPLPRSFRLLLVLAALILLCALAPADAYKLAYSGGTCAVTNGSPGGAYRLTSSGWGYGGSGQSANCSGTITATFTWRGPNDTAPTTPSPSSVVLVQTCVAGAASVPGGSRSASNGLGDAGVVSGNSVSSGYGGDGNPKPHYSVVAAGDSFTATCNPSASASPGSSASVYYTAAATPVEIVLGGGLGPNTAKRYLIGQACTATISAPLPIQVTGTQPMWSVSGGQPFRSWSATRDAATFNTPPAPLVGTTSIGWYFKTREDNATITFSGHLVVPSGSQPAAGLDVSLTRNCRSEIPASASLSAYTYQNAGSLALPGYPANGVGLYTQPYPTIMSILGVSAPKYGPGGTGVVGIRWDAEVLTPSDFGGGGGWNFVQLIDPQRTRVYHGVQQTLPINGHTGLDNTYPYEPGPYDPDSGSPGTVLADGNSDYYGDAPSVGLGWPDVTHVTANESFETWLMYRPPGTGSTFVPLKALTWNWAGEASTDGMGVWSMGSSDSGWYFDSDYPPHPEWSSRLDNSQLGSWTPSVP